MQLFLPAKYFHKLYIACGFFVVILLSGTVGYILIEDYRFIEAFYMTVITLSTVGFTEVHPLSDGGRIFTSILIIVNIGTFTYFITLLSNYFLDGEFTRTYKLYKMKEAIKQLEGHVIICGFGRNGREAAKIFHNNGTAFVAIEKTETRKDDLLFDVPYVLENDATRDETLLEAGILRARALVTTLPDDADNLYVVLTARELNPKLKIISRASNDASVRKLRTAGASNVIMPDKIGGMHMATSVLSPNVSEFVDIMASQNNGHFSITEIETNRTLVLEELNCWNATGATILGIRAVEGEYSLNPIPKTIVRPGNKLIVMGSKDQLTKVQQLVSE